MGITYKVDVSLGLIHVYWSGPIRVEDLAGYYRSITADPTAMAIRRTLTNLQEADLQFTGAELNHLIATIAVPALQGKGWRSAILVREKAQFGVARQYQVFANHYSEDSIFLDEGEARQWLCGPSGVPLPAGLAAGTP